MCFIHILNVYNSCVKEACWIFLFSISKINVISLRCHNKDTLWIFWWMLRNFLLSGTTLFSIWFWITIDLCMKYQFPNSWLFDVLNLYEKLFHISNSFSIQFVSGISEIFFVYLFVVLYFWSNEFHFAFCLQFCLVVNQYLIPNIGITKRSISIYLYDYLVIN